MKGREMTSSRPATVTSGGERPSITCQLALGARAGEPGSFDELYGRVGPSMLAWARMPKHFHLRSCMDPEDLVQDVADRLQRGQVVGWFQGRMEWGPRALGNRSILADPRRDDMQQVLNEKIKRRESFRPFAPSIH